MMIKECNQWAQYVYILMYIEQAYVYWTSKDLVCKKEEIKYNNIIKQYKNL